MNTVHEIIPAALAGERLDRVVSLMTDLSRADAAILVAQGDVEVNGTATTTKAHRLSLDDDIVVHWEPAAMAVTTIEPDDDVVFTVVYEDDDVVVIDKPPGLVVHVGAGHRTGTLVHGLVARYPAVATVGEPGRPGVVHRLDKDTSGLMMVARTAEASDALIGQLSRREVDRRYLALVWGSFEVAAGVIEAPIGRSSRDPTRMAVSVRGRDAVTHYSVRDSFSEPAPVTLIECKLETGRTHQIRVHMQAIGHPVVGDGRYHGHRQTITTPRMFLHAAELSFHQPVTGEVLSFTTPLPADLQAVLDTLS